MTWALPRSLPEVRQTVGGEVMPSSHALSCWASHLGVYSVLVLSKLGSWLYS
jgi:hypothetical protein